jgi:hypothetical protein
MEVVMLNRMREKLGKKGMACQFIIVAIIVSVSIGSVMTEAGALEDCNKCKFKKDIEKAIQDNEQLKQISENDMKRWHEEIASVKATGRGYPDSRRQSDLDRYFNEGRAEREGDFKKSAGYSKVTSLDTDPVSCDSDVVPKKKPKDEQARKKKSEDFKKGIKCSQLFDLAVQHEKNHVEACKNRNKNNIKVTAEDLAREEVQEYQKIIEELKNIKFDCKPYAAERRGLGDNLGTRGGWKDGRSPFLPSPKAGS